MLLISYKLTGWYDGDRPVRPPQYEYDIEVVRTEEYPSITVTMKTPPSAFEKARTACTWFVVYILVMNSAPRMFISASQQLQGMIRHGTLLSTVICNDGVAGVMYAAALGFVEVGLNNVMMRYLNGSVCDNLSGSSRVYLPFKNREDVKMAVRTWGGLLHRNILVTALVKPGLRPAMATVQYVVLGLTVAGLSAWDLLKSPCHSYTVFQDAALCMLLACECLWVLGQLGDILQGNKEAWVHLFWHQLVLVAVRCATSMAGKQCRNSQRHSCRIPKNMGVRPELNMVLLVSPLGCCDPQLVEASILRCPSTPQSDLEISGTFVFGFSSNVVIEGSS